MKKILVTGFQPFGGETMNPAWEAVRRLPDTIAGASVTKVEIPVVFGKGPEAVDKAIVVTDRATLFNLLIGLDGYTISSGILSADLNGTDIVAVPLEPAGTMEIGYISQVHRPLSALAKSYLDHLESYVRRYFSNSDI